MNIPLRTLKLKGWVEKDGRRLYDEEIREMLTSDPAGISDCGGEFHISWNGCCARDHFGVIPGQCPPGRVVCGEEERYTIVPDTPVLPLEDAIVRSIHLRSDEGVVALSGGVDSTLVAKLADLPCVAVGMSNSHDLRRARLVATELGFHLDTVELTSSRIKEALYHVISIMPTINPLDVSIAATLYFVAAWAGDHGYTRILAGQGADELFGGYARYLKTETLETDLERDVAGLPMQIQRDQAVASVHNTYFSLPYLDLRVVRASMSIPALEKVQDGIRKLPLRLVAARYLPSDIAFYEKKAMQYGSGIWREMQRLARQNGYKNSVQRYLRHIGSTMHDL